jgi:hypothetical protein
MLLKIVCLTFIKNSHDWGKADKWIEENADETYPGFKKAFPQFPFTDVTYYGRCKKILSLISGKD